MVSVKVTSPLTKDVPEAVFNQSEAKLAEYISQLKTTPVDSVYPNPSYFFQLPFDESILAAAYDLANDYKSPYLRYIFVLGIGGSNLGAKAVYDAMHGFTDLLEPERYPKMIFVETNDPQHLTQTTAFLKEQCPRPDEYLILVISKSGTTTETLVNIEVLLNHVPQAQQRMIVVSAENTALVKQAQQKKIATLTMPHQVTGRFSVFTAVGLLPLALAGIDIQLLRKGAQDITPHCLDLDIFTNPALFSASLLHYYQGQGKTIHDSFFFHPELETLGKWYRQLTGESLGKKFDAHGQIVHAGITPMVSIGTTDLHSVGQLDLGGPQDKITSFIFTETAPHTITVPSELVFPGLVDNIEGKSLNHIMAAILAGVKTSYQAHHLPYIEVNLTDISPVSLGGFMQLKMFEVVYLAKMMEINAFDQPQVESYKQATRKILQGKT